MRINSIRSIRVFKILYTFVFFVFIIVLRLFQLQIKEQDILTNRGERNFLKTEVIRPPRGNFLDCKGRLLASNRPIFDLFWQGHGSRSLDAEKLELLSKLGQILTLDLLTRQIKQEITIAERYSRKTLICENIDFDQLCKISELSGNNPNLFVKNRFERVYLFGSLASHVLGFLSRLENIGRAGLEKLLQTELRGQDGCVLSIINSTGKELALREIRGARAGDDVQLTIDLNLQFLAESLFQEGQRGAFVLMDPESGAVRVLVSHPNFNPNVFLSPITEGEWSKLSENNPLLNRATCAMCPPASIFKLVSIATGIEEGIISPQTEFFCKGYIKFCGRKYRCMKRYGHGNLDPRIALAKSCNTYCFEIAKQINIDKFALYAQCLGLGQKTGFLLPEKEGLVPTTTWKRLFKNERWWKGETLSVSIGQGYLMSTPLQIARMVAAVCSGHLVRPRILESERVDSKRLDISGRTLRVLRDGMRAAVQEGTVRMLSFIKNFDVYAKTGTAQTCSLIEDRTSTDQLEHAWAAGFFKYGDEKPFVLTILVENVGSSAPAVMIASKFLRAYKALKENSDNSNFRDLQSAMMYTSTT